MLQQTLISMAMPLVIYLAGALPPKICKVEPVKQNVVLTINKQSPQVVEVVQKEPIQIKPLITPQVVNDYKPQANQLTNVNLPAGKDVIIREIEKYDWDSNIAVAVGMAESGLNEKSISRTGDYGVMQVNQCHRALVKGNLNALLDYKTNIWAAYQVYKGSGWRAWTTYKSGAFRKYLN